MSALAPWQWAWAAAAILFAAVLRGFTGFGFAVAAVPLASLVLPPQPVVAALLIMQCAIGLRDCIAERKLADWRAVRRLVAGAVMGTPIGLAVLTLLPMPWIRLMLGVLVAIAVLVTWRPLRHRGPPARRWGLLAGFCSGVSNGLAAMAGPPAIVYFLVAENDRILVRSSLMVFFPLASALALPPAIWAGLVGQESLWLAALGLPLMIAGGWLGTRMFVSYGGLAYRPIALAALAFTALASLARGLSGLLP